MKQLLAAILTSFGIASMPVHGAFPDQPITIVIPYAPGGMSGAVAGAISDRLSASLGQSVMIEHSAGASGSIGASRVKNAAPGGHIIMLAPQSVYVATPLIRKPTPYHALQDFDLLTIAVRMPNVLAVRADLPVDNLNDFIAYLRAANGSALIATPGESSLSALTARRFWRETDTRGHLVHYKGGSPALNAILNGDAAAIFLNIGTLLPAINSGKLKALTVSSHVRWPALPDVPTMREAGLPDFELYNWQGFAAPKGLPPEVKNKLQRALVDALHTPAIKRSLIDEGFEVVGGSAEDFERFLRVETAHWQSVIEDADLE